MTSDLSAVRRDLRAWAKRQSFDTQAIVTTICANLRKLEADPTNGDMLRMTAANVADLGQAVGR